MPCGTRVSGSEAYKSEAKMKERRKYVRFKTSLEAVYKVMNGLPVEIKTKIGDVSREGIRLVDGNDLERDAVVELKIRVPGYEIPVAATAQSVWSQKGGEAFYNKGMRLIKIRSSDRAQMIEYAYDQLIRK